MLPLARPGVITAFTINSSGCGTKTELSLTIINSARAPPRALCVAETPCQYTSDWPVCSRRHHRHRSDAHSYAVLAEKMIAGRRQARSMRRQTDALFVAGFATETNTFSPIFADLDTSAHRRSCRRATSLHPDVSTHRASHRPPAGEPARKGGADRGHDGLRLTRWGCSARGLRTSARSILRPIGGSMPVDGVPALPARAMVAVGVDDPEGESIEVVRAVVGGASEDRRRDRPEQPSDGETRS